MLDNALIRQKDHIIDLIDSGKHETAVTLLEFVKELWEECHYDYKWREMKERGLTASRSNDDTLHWKQLQKQQHTHDLYRSL